MYIVRYNIIHNTYMHMPYTNCKILLSLLRLGICKHGFSRIHGIIIKIKVDFFLLCHVYKRIQAFIVDYAIFSNSFTIEKF